MLNPAEMNKFHALAADTIAINQMVGNNNNPGVETFRHQMEIIASEFEELEDGFNLDNRTELRDGLADVFFTVGALYGRMHWPLPNVLPEPCHGEDPAALVTWIGRQMSALKVLSTLSFGSMFYDARKITFYVARQITDQIMTNCVVLGKALKIDLLADWEAVNTSNWTKFDSDSETAARTVKKYEDKGIAVYQTMVGRDDGKTFFVTFSLKEQFDEKGRAMPANKWLKSINFVDVDFSEPTTAGDMAG